MLFDYLLNFGLLASDPISYFRDLLLVAIIVVPAILIGITVHEFSHALAANHLGDTTAKRLGRISLNPLVHLDPVGTLLILFAGFGWGKPVPVDPYHLRGGMRKGMAMVAFAGPLSNLIVAALVAAFIRFGLIGLPPAFDHLLAGRPGGAGLFVLGLVSVLVSFMIQINLILAVFNLIPLAPLDGFNVALGILPRELSESFARTAQYGMAILLMLFAFDYFFKVGIFGRVIGPIVSGLSSLLLGY